jgi:hypothetical protein
MQAAGLDEGLKNRRGKLISQAAFAAFNFLLHAP